MNWLNLVLMVVSVMIIAIVLLQAQGTGLGKVMGGSGGGYRSKKGLENFLFYLTIALVVVFSILSLLNVLK